VTTNLAFVLLSSYAVDFLINAALASAVLYVIIKNHFGHKIWRPLFTFWFIDLSAQAIVSFWLMIMRVERIYVGDVSADLLFSSPVWVMGNVLNAVSSVLFVVTIVVLVFLNDSVNKKEG
jgi:hypothetical protein